MTIDVQQSMFHVGYVTYVLAHASGTGR